MYANLATETLDVTVSIMSYKRPLYLAEAIKSVLYQSKKPVIIYVFDNGSGEDVRQVVAAFENDGVVWRGAELPGTPLWNFRRALDAADSKYVYVMHDDDRLCIDFLEKQVAILESNAEALAVACNGFIINSMGARTGVMIGPSTVYKNDMYDSGAKVALLYALDSWLTFASVVYKADNVRQLPIREEYGKVADAVFLCDLADKGSIVYQNIPLYEYRIHNGQDSNLFPLPVLQKLEEFLFSRISDDAELNALLQCSIRRLSTKRIIEKITNDLKNYGILSIFNHYICSIRFKYFSLPVAIKYLFMPLKQRLIKLCK